MKIERAGKYEYFVFLTDGTGKPFSVTGDKPIMARYKGAVPMIVLGIESSCDETGVALVEVTQHKGDSECRAGADPLCGFEKLNRLQLFNPVSDPNQVFPARNYVRNVLKWQTDLHYPTSGDVRPWNWDEFEKAMAGSDGTDTSGTASEMHGTLLSEMEDMQYTGMIFIGVAGSCKSYLVKCAGSTFGLPVVQMQIS